MKQPSCLEAFTLSLFLLLNASIADAAPPWCRENKPVKFAGITWESGQFFTELARIIIEKGYDCKTEVVLGSTAETESKLVNNDLQVWAEQWGSRSAILKKGRSALQVNLIGDVLEGGTVEGWFVPEYMIKGDEKRGIKPLAPNLKSVADLMQYKDLFAGSDGSGKARFVNCPTDWDCEKNNTRKLKAYRLDGAYDNWHAANGAELDTAIAAAYEQGKPVLFYYWAPAGFLGKYQFVQLQEPAYNEACWNTIVRNVTSYVCGSATPATHIYIGISAPFEREAPELVAFFEKYSLPVGLVTKTIADMAERKVGAAVVAQEFMLKNKALWKRWVSAGIAAKIEKNL